jgi:phospholipid/cholesterol/gamma-HCH transport system substrate-binding protein
MSCGPFLEQLNPTLAFLGLYSHDVADFTGYGAGGLANTIHSPSGGIGHYLRQFGANGPETVSIYSQRTPNSRGNAYLSPTALTGPEIARRLIWPNWDCNPSNGETDATQPGKPDSHAACWVQPPFQFQGKSLKYPQVAADNYKP